MRLTFVFNKLPNLGTFFRLQSAWDKRRLSKMSCVDPAIIEKWTSVQSELRNNIITDDTEQWQSDFRYGNS